MRHHQHVPADVQEIRRQRRQPRGSEVGPVTGRRPGGQMAAGRLVGGPVGIEASPGLSLTARSVALAPRPAAPSAGRPAPRDRPGARELPSCDSGTARPAVESRRPAFAHSSSCPAVVVRHVVRSGSSTLFHEARLFRATGGGTGRRVRWPTWSGPPEPDAPPGRRGSAALVQSALDMPQRVESGPRSRRPGTTESNH